MGKARASVGQWPSLSDEQTKGPESRSVRRPVSEAAPTFIPVNAQYELIVIGGGSAGHAAAATGAGLGLRCALIESAAELGGLCILRGCMPSKALIETANRLRDIRRASRFGIEVPSSSLDLPALRRRVRDLVEDFRKSRVEEMESGAYELIRGRCRMLSEHQVEVTKADGETRVMEAAAFVIATGSSPVLPDIPGLAGTPCWTSDDVIRMERLPARIAILGGGAIGMECAHLFEGLGSEVTVILRSDRILGGFDPDVRAALESASRERGIAFLFGTSLSRVDHDGTIFSLHFEDGGGLECDAFLAAAGRRPCTAGLGLEEIGIAMEEGRVLIDDHAAASLPHIFAAGDCASPVPVVHLAVLQGEAAACNAANLIRGDRQGVASWGADHAMFALFTEPQVMRVGIDETEARSRGYAPVCGRQDYADHGKGLIAGERHGFVKVVADRASGRLLGATAAGPQVVESGHLLQFAIARGLTCTDYLALPHYHPTFSEAWSRAIAGLAEKCGA